MDGRLKFNAGENGGSIFSFVVRAGEAPASFARQHRDLDAERLHVYVADDDAVSRRDLLMTLLAERIGVAGSGPAAGLLDALRAADTAGRLPDLVLVGQVQELDRDLAIAADLASDSRLAHIPLVLAPVSGMRGHAHAVHQAGYSAYLPRPFHTGELLQCLRAVLPGAGSSPDSARHTSPSDAGTRLITRHRLADEQRVASAGRVLIADDDPANLKVTRLQVERLGYPVDVVENGAEAVAAASRCDYQIVLMDCQMPTMNGLVATTEIRRRGDGRGPVIVAVTAETGEEWRQRCLLAGMNDVLEKPVRTHVLAEILNRYARTRGAALTEQRGRGGPARRAHARLDEARPTGDREGRPTGDREARAGGINDLIADVGLELTLELAREYVTGVTRALETVATGDLVAIRQDAHRLLGSARTLSLATFERLWLRVEDLASLPEEIPAETIDELRRARVELERWIERHHEKHCA